MTGSAEGSAKLWWNVLVDHLALLQTAESVALSAGGLLWTRFGLAASGVGAKSTPTDLVSDADRASDDLVRRLISETRPGDSILSEETGQSDSQGAPSGFRWIVDPLDGTINFLFGIPVWAISIAVEDPDGTVVGVVYDPNRNEVFAASRGKGATLNGMPIQVSDSREPSRALIGTGFSYDSRARELQAAILSRVLPRVRDIRRAGSATLDLCSVACGRLDGCYEAPLELWDKAAGALIVEEAGGDTSELAGPLDHADGLICAGPGLHDQLRALVLG